MNQDRRVTLHLPRYATWGLGVLLLGPWLVFAAWVLSHRSTTAPATQHVAPQHQSTVRTAFSGATLSHPGPWGHLEYFRILIEPPEEFILSSYTQPQPHPWVFKGYTEPALAALWQSAGLTAAQLQFVSAPAHREVRTDAIVIHPDADLIIGLTPAARTTIYSALGDFSENVPQANPFRLRATLATEWLDNADVPPEALALTRKLFYPRGTALCFSDDAIVLPLIHDNAARVRYLKTLSRKAAMMVYLNVRPGEDVDKLVRYWARGGRSKDLKPLLESLARNPDGGHIDIVHLLPRFARLLAYTYPLPSDKPIDANHDCHWSSFNFQNDQPDERFSNIDYVREVLLEQYYPVPGDPTLGDIVMFVRADGVVIHSCVYIADDIVFTKNGPGYSVPWLLSPLADVQAFYASTPGIEMRRYRAKNL